ncbi:hypothetical protein HPB52_021897 [Rhipicephalus sanguineus]|uniref:Uncharacterized protein n=1 Tax=Rhipicephalus sanguineus TaxID=34632 RepID=A0A9D4PXT1_RHISA|nr:hypothetical protein HPB52_021897 [Rhipicephalus sanguineus]
MQPPTPPTNASVIKTLTYEKRNQEVEAHAVKTKARENSGHAPPPEQSAALTGPSRVSEMREGSNSGIATQTVVVLTKPCFYIILISMVAADFIVPLLSTTIVDYALDKELPPDQSWRLVTFLSVGSMCGHLVIPLLSDKLSRGRSLMAALSFTLLSLCFIVMPQVHGFATIGVVAFVAGVQQGYLNTLKPVLVADYLGVGSVAVSWGLMGLASLPLTFCEPTILVLPGCKKMDRLVQECTASILTNMF